MHRYPVAECDARCSYAPRDNDISRERKVIADEYGEIIAPRLNPARDNYSRGYARESTDKPRFYDKL